MERVSLKERGIMNYEEAMQYIHAVQWAGHKPGLTRTRTLLAALGDPHKRLKFVHVAGTNGKGSTAAMLASCLQAAGYRVGLYTSPFINRFNERIQVNGEQISDEELVRLVEKIRPAADAMADVPTEFEIITALGMLCFAEQHCDIVVLEVGLGGALDSTNVIDPPECAVITALGMDSGALSFTVFENIQRSAGGCPACQWLSLWESWQRECVDGEGTKKRFPMQVGEALFLSRTGQGK